MIYWGAFSLNSHQTLLEGCHVITMLMSIASNLSVYLGIMGWRPASDLIAPHQNTQTPWNPTDIRVGNNLYESICIKMSKLLVIYEIISC